VYQCGAYRDVEDLPYSDMDGPTGTPLAFNPTPVHVFQMPGKPKEIFAGRSFNAALLPDHTLVTWGTCKLNIDQCNVVEYDRHVLI
jgi:hypothetical protein